MKKLPSEKEPKRTYSTPRLKTYGDIRSLTRNKDNLQKNDGVSSGTHINRTN
jgi:hypothetical protein